MHKPIYYIVILVLILTACRKDEYDLDVKDNEPITSATTTRGDVAGLIYNEAGAGVHNASISIGNNSMLTDANGYFKFSNIELSKDGGLVTVEKPGYFDNYKFVTVNKTAPAYLQATLISSEKVVFIDSEIGGEYNLGSGAKVVLKPQSFSNHDGSDYNGQVKVSAYWYRPDDTNLPALMPGDLRGIDENGDQQQLVTFGMMAVELRSPQGTELNLKEGQTAQLVFPLSQSLLDQAPESVPTWYLNEDTGYWEEEGEAILENGNYLAEVSHFSFWNCDANFPLVEVKGRLIDEDGLAIPNRYVSIYIEGSSIGGYGITNNEGQFKGKVPQGQPLSLLVWYCQEELANKDLGFLQSDTDLGDIEIRMSDFSRRVSATLLDCTNMPLTDGYALIKNGYRSELLIPDAEGAVIGIAAGCGQPDMAFHAYDPSKLNSIEPIKIAVGNDLLDLGDLIVCSQVEEYITFSLDENLTNLITDAQVFLINGEFLNIVGREANLGFSTNIPLSTINVPFTVEGINDQISGYTDDGELHYLSCAGPNGSTGSAGTCLEYSINQLGQVGERIIGAFTGSLGVDTIQTAGTYDVEGDFNLEIDKIFNTASVSGEVWLDANANGLRDNGELPIPDVFFNVRNVQANNPSQIYLEGSIYRSDENGEYKIIGLIPGEEYQVTSYLTSAGEITIANAGDDLIDSDFEVTNGNQISSHIFIPNDGQELTQVDLGYTDRPLECSVGYSGCSPDISVNVFISGGVPPYDVNFSSIGTQTGGSNIVFENVPPGQYQIQVEDQTGAMSSCAADIAEFRNAITGRVWLDLRDGGIGEDKRDNADDKFNDYGMELLNENNTVVQLPTDISVNGTYRFDFVPAGKYRLRAILQSSSDFELVTEGVGLEYEDSDFDPVTGLTELFEFTSCQGYLSFDLGVKSK